MATIHQSAGLIEVHQEIISEQWFRLLPLWLLILNELQKMNL
ncbi:MAG: hypothetical protein QMC23_12130 [Rubritalea sp.]|jgi:hypothetical protein|tara:strand:+ start:1004 stop:1129 length:126 start_codon:yes stop_codon:yes gene_type:complete